MKHLSLIFFAAVLANLPTVSADAQPTINDMKQQALYHQPGKDPKSFDILDEHSDGTVDLGHHDTVVVSRCPLSPIALPGTATLTDGKSVPMTAIPHGDLVQGLEAASKEIERQREQIESLRRDNEKRLGDLVAAHAREVEAMKASHAEALKLAANKDSGSKAKGTA